VHNIISVLIIAHFNIVASSFLTLLHLHWLYIIEWRVLVMNLEILAVVYIKFLFQNLLHKTEETTRVPQSE
jgi:hypothetical protein